jgi:cation/acetate symporter
MTWSRFTTRGAVASMVTGTVSSLVLILLSPTVWVGLLHNDSAIVPLKNPGIITVPLSFAVAVIVSLLAPEPEARTAFAGAQRRMLLGPSAEEP